jgi:hypothetical protein
MNFTNDVIEQLITCSKTMIDPPSKEFKEENRHRRKDMRLQDVDNKVNQFSVFMRQSLEFDEDFSIGLVYFSSEGKRITLIRYNGQHEQSNDPFSLQNPHYQYHIHQATPENLNNGRYEKHPAFITPDYASFQEAIAQFLTKIRLIEIETYFPDIEVLSLFRNTETS